MNKILTLEMSFLIKGCAAPENFISIICSIHAKEDISWKPFFSDTYLCDNSNFYFSSSNWISSSKRRMNEGVYLIFGLFPYQWRFARAVLVL